MPHQGALTFQVTLLVEGPSEKGRLQVRVVKHSFYISDAIESRSQLILWQNQWSAIPFVFRVVKKSQITKVGALFFEIST